MNVKSVETSLAKYHLLHFVIGAIFAVVMLAVPKTIGVIAAAFLVALCLPSALLPDFVANKWYDRGAVLLGAVAVAFVFFFLHKL